MKQKKKKLNEKSVFAISRVQSRTLTTEKVKMLSSSLKIIHSRGGTGLRFLAKNNLSIVQALWELRKKILKGLVMTSHVFDH